MTEMDLLHESRLKPLLQETSKNLISLVIPAKAGIQRLCSSTL
jgi:hypothetical protein